MQSSSLPQLSDVRQEPGRPSEVRQGKGLNSLKINEKCRSGLEEKSCVSEGKDSGNSAWSVGKTHGVGWGGESEGLLEQGFRLTDGGRLWLHFIPASII